MSYKVNCEGIFPDWEKDTKPEICKSCVFLYACEVQRDIKNIFWEEIKETDFDIVRPLFDGLDMKKAA